MKQIIGCILLVALLAACGDSVSPLVSSEETLDPQIVGGTQARPGAYPWMAAIIQNGTAECGGSLIHEQWVLTAAHCVEDNANSYTVRLGEHDLNRTEGTEQEIRVTGITQHPSWDITTGNNDIALLRLATPAVINATIGARVGIAEIGTLSSVGTNLRVIGWGQTAENRSRSNTLLQVDVPLVSGALCATASSSTSSAVFCAGNTRGSVGTCFGDSGGPIFDGDNRQVGLVSYGDGACGSITVYTDVSQFVNWIYSIVPPSLIVKNILGNNVWAYTRNAFQTWTGDSPNGAVGSANRGTWVRVGAYSSRGGSWSGCDGTSYTSNKYYCSATMTQTRTVTFTAPPQKFKLYVRVSGPMTVTSLGFNCTESGGDCSEEFRKGFQTMLSHNYGNSAVWSGCTSVVGNACNVTMDSSRIVSVSLK